MAIKLEKELKDSGVVSTYHRITRLSGFGFDSGSVHIGHYFDDKTRQDGKNYIGFDDPITITLTKDESDQIKTIIYTALARTEEYKNGSKI